MGKSIDPMKSNTQGWSDNDAYTDGPVTSMPPSNDPIPDGPTVLAQASAVNELDDEISRQETQGAVDNVRERIGDAAQIVVGETTQTVAPIVETAKAAAEDAKDAMTAAAESTSESVKAMASSASQSVKEAASAAGERVKVVAANAGESAKRVAVTLSDGAKDAGQKIAQTAKSHPTAAVLTGVGTSVGIGWLIWMARKNQAAQDQASMVRESRETMSDVVGRMKERAMDVASTVSDKAHDAKEATSEFVHANPMAVGAIAVGVGVGIGLMIPESVKEREFMGETRDKIKEVVGSRMKEMGSKLRSVAADTLHTSFDDGA